MRVEHLLPSGLLGRRPVRILVVGAGGTGSAIVMGLPYLHQAMRAWGHAYGLEVTLMDGDRVSETNCVRQPFSWSDVGQNKATVLINRINLFWGTKWNAQPVCFDETTLRSNHDHSPDFLIGCVDTRAARSVIERSVMKRSSYVAYWLDLGNNASSSNLFWVSRSMAGTAGRPNCCERSASSIRRLPMPQPAKTRCRVAPRSRRSNGKSPSSIRLSRRAPWQCWRDFSVTQGSLITGDYLMLHREL